jgi:hypothetical protein
MRKRGYGLRRIYLPRTSVNKEQKDGGSPLLDLHPTSRRELRFPTVLYCAGTLWKEVAVSVTLSKINSLEPAFCASR